LNIKSGHTDNEDKLYEPYYQFKQLGTGIRLSYVELGSGSGTPVILLHGATDSYISFSQVGNVLSEMGCYALIPELRGHGRSDKPTEQVYSIPLLTDDILDWLDKMGITSAHIVGHSLGSFIAQNIAIHRPQLATSLTLIGSAAHIADNPMVAWLLDGDGEFPGIRHMEGNIDDGFIREWVSSTNSDPRFAEYTYKHAAVLPYDTWVGVFSGIEADHSKGLSGLRMPVQIIWGTQDEFFPKATQLALIDAIGSDTILFRTKPAGHNTHWESNLGLEIAQNIYSFTNAADKRESTYETSALI